MNKRNVSARKIGIAVGFRATVKDLQPESVRVAVPAKKSRSGNAPVRERRSLSDRGPRQSGKYVWIARER